MLSKLFSTLLSANLETAASFFFFFKKKDETTNVFFGGVAQIKSGSCCSINGSPLVTLS